MRDCPLLPPVNGLRQTNVLRRHERCGQQVLRELRALPEVSLEPGRRSDDLLTKLVSEPVHLQEVGLFAALGPRVVLPDPPLVLLEDLQPKFLLQNRLVGLPVDSLPRLPLDVEVLDAFDRRDDDDDEDEK